jgi:hypothetical protein
MRDRGVIPRVSIDLLAERDSPHGLAALERARLLEILRRHGRNTTSFQTLEPTLLTHAARGALGTRDGSNTNR